MYLKPLAFFAAMALGSAAMAQSYELDPGHTEISFAWNHVGLTTQRGEWLSISGGVDFNPEDVTATQVTVEIDSASLHTGVEELDEILKGPDYFDTETYPTITFVSTSAVQTGAENMRMTGDLTVKGQMTPVTLDVELTFMGKNPLGEFLDYYQGDWVGVEAKGTVLRSALGVGMFAPIVSDTVELSISAEMREGGWPE